MLKPKYIFIVYTWSDRQKGLKGAEYFYYSKYKALRRCNDFNCSMHNTSLYFVRREYIC